MADGLLQQRRRLLDQLPSLDEVLRGSVVHRAIRCGRPGCHCASSGGHRVTYLSVTHRGGRTEQISLPPALVPQVRRGVRIYQRWWAILEQVSAINRTLVRQERERVHARARQGGRRRRRDG
jgi:hypothetical protein